MLKNGKCAFPQNIRPFSYFRTCSAVCSSWFHFKDETTFSLQFLLFQAKLIEIANKTAIKIKHGIIKMSSKLSTKLEFLWNICKVDMYIASKWYTIRELKKKVDDLVKAKRKFYLNILGQTEIIRIYESAKASKFMLIFSFDF